MVTKKPLTIHFRVKFEYVRIDEVQWAGSVNEVITEVLLESTSLELTLSFLHAAVDERIRVYTRAVVLNENTTNNRTSRVHVSTGKKRLMLFLIHMS